MFLVAPSFGIRPYSYRAKTNSHRIGVSLIFGTEPRQYRRCSELTGLGKDPNVPELLSRRILQRHPKGGRRASPEHHWHGTPLWARQHRLELVPNEFLCWARGQCASTAPRLQLEHLPHRRVMNTATASTVLTHLWLGFWRAILPD